MPPPRLTTRQLRPCHPPGNVQPHCRVARARYASRATDDDGDAAGGQRSSEGTKQPAASAWPSLLRPSSWFKSSTAPATPSRATTPPPPSEADQSQPVAPSDGKASKHAQPGTDDHKEAKTSTSPVQQSEQHENQASNHGQRPEPPSDAATVRALLEQVKMMETTLSSLLAQQVQQTQQAHQSQPAVIKTEAQATGPRNKYRRLTPRKARIFAEKRYNMLINDDIGISKSLRTIKSPKIQPLVFRTHSRLAALEEEATRAEDDRLLRILSPYMRSYGPVFKKVKVGTDDKAGTELNYLINSEPYHETTALPPVQQQGHVRLMLKTRNDGQQRPTSHNHPRAHTVVPPKAFATTLSLSSQQAATPRSTNIGMDGRANDVNNEIPFASSGEHGESTAAQSLLEELFPEANKKPEPAVPEQRNHYPKLGLPDLTPVVRRESKESPRDVKQQVKQQVKQSFTDQSEQTTVLQLTNCGVNLTEVDFVRLIPKGKHIENWRRDGGFVKVIPGRDPINLTRLPFYYILFRNQESALAYQKNVSRVHKLNALHQPSNIFSAIPAPKGFVEDGEDISSITSSYNLLPTHHAVSLAMLVQPYNPALRALLERGGYQPIAPDTDDQGNRIWKVLMHIEGYEPMHLDLYKILQQDAFRQGIPFTLRNESSKSIHRLRDMINLKTSVKAVSSASPRAYGTFDHTAPRPEHREFEDPAVQDLMAGADEDASAKEVNQYVMNRLYNRWILDFDDEDAARRFAINWHRKVLPELSDSNEDRGNIARRQVDEARICNTEVLW